MAGVKALRRLQLGDESTPGTAVAASAIWRGTGMGADTRTVEFPEEDIGRLSKYDRSYVPMLGAEITMDSIPATFEQLPYILEAGVATETPTQDGTGAAYIYEYLFPTSAQNTPRTYTIEFGDDQQAEEAEYCFVREFTLEGNAGEALMMSATWQGRQVQTTTFTGSIAVPAVEEILFSKGKLYIDGTGTYPATTLKSNTLLSMNLSVTTGFTAVQTASGNLYFSFLKQQFPEITLQITFEHDATSVAEKAAWRAGTPRAIRLLFEGSASAGNTTYNYKTLIIDLVGKWQTFDALGDQDGNDIVVGTFLGRENSTAGDAGGFIVVNELSALP